MVRDWQDRLIISHPGDYYTTRHSVRIFDQDFTLFRNLGIQERERAVPMSRQELLLWGQACGSNNCRFLVSDSGNNRIQIFDENAAFLSAFGTVGSGNGQFNNPQGLAIGQKRKRNSCR